MRRSAREFSPARYGVCIIGWRDENEEKEHCWRLINCPFDLFPRGQMTPITGRRRIWVGSGCRLFRPRPSPSPRSTATPVLCSPVTPPHLPRAVRDHFPSSTVYTATTTNTATPLLLRLLLPLPLPWYTRS